MNFTRRASSCLLISLLCSLLLLLQVGGAHLHLCFDGQEPPATLHLVDSGLEHSPGLASLQHQDEEVDIGLASLLKKSLSALDIPPVAYAAFVRPLESRSQLVLRSGHGRGPSFIDVTRLLPPLRGPPPQTIT